MRSIAVLNQKGGVGKTTTAVNLAAGLARAGLRVCVIDLDPQAHASLHLGLGVATGHESVYEVLVGDASLADVRKQVAENLWVVPAHLDLAAAEMELAGEVGREVILYDKLEADDQEFDYLIIDCPPSLGVLTLNALAAVTEVFLPLQPHFLALHGLSKLLRTVDIVARRINNNLRLTGVILCLFESSTRLAGEVAGDVDQFFGAGAGANTAWADAQVFRTRIRRNIRLAEAPSFGQSIFEYDADSNGAEDYANLAREVMGIALSNADRPKMAGAA
ncbi:ParA family protein [Blastopirellula marina]|uniref:Chromosome partitioning protein ParA n=1 Tax=Blastopirellula marina TaxID=124 RepID=A0A2S8GT64_9BACT|nr:AAA family ATPase [Blastopirellula marina]PQO47602.1 chromosome partitioning protein ParA [Blastopirellula marina]